MQEHIIEEQTCDMGHGRGEYLFSAHTTLEQALKWFKNNLRTWGTIVIKKKDYEILRLFDYDLYNQNCFYHHLNGWEYNFPVKKIEFYYCFMSRDIHIYLDK